jgi:glutamate 5-kinase
MLRRIVLKLGTHAVIDEQGRFARSRLGILIRDYVALVERGVARDLILVSSGAVGLGRTVLGIQGELSLRDKQACAAVGQSQLMREYTSILRRSRLAPAQLLLTAADFSDRTRFVHLRETLDALLRMKVLPIINENDVVSAAELEPEVGTKSFSDNDRLAALVAAKLGADLLVLLTDVDAIYTDNPARNPAARRISRVGDDVQLHDVVARGKSRAGRGGMESKIAAARIAANSGVDTLVASALNPGVVTGLGRIAAEGMKVLAELGTWVPARAQVASSRKRWISDLSGVGGVVVVNAGAAQAIRSRGASLLPSGVTAVNGRFAANSVVSIRDEAGREIARGVTPLSSESIVRVRGMKSREAAQTLGRGVRGEVIHRNLLVVSEGH